MHFSQLWHVLTTISDYRNERNSKKHRMVPLKRFRKDRGEPGYLSGLCRRRRVTGALLSEPKQSHYSFPLAAVKTFESFRTRDAVMSRALVYQTVKALQEKEYRARDSVACFGVYRPASAAVWTDSHQRGLCCKRGNWTACRARACNLQGVLAHVTASQSHIYKQYHPYHYTACHCGSFWLGFSRSPSLCSLHFFLHFPLLFLFHFCYFSASCFCNIKDGFLQIKLSIL